MASASRTALRLLYKKEASGSVYHLSPGHREPDAFFAEKQ
jgi:hypothetical protein